MILKVSMRFGGFHGVILYLMHILYDLQEMSIRCMESLGLAGWSYGGKFYELKVHLTFFVLSLM